MAPKFKISIQDNKGNEIRAIDTKQDLKDIGKFVKKKHIEISREILREEQAKGFDKKPRTRVDHRWDVPEEAVKPFGKIEYHARVDITETLVSIYRSVIERSPRNTGLYKSGHKVFLNSRLVASNVFELKSYLSKADIKQDDVFRFINTRPYATRLEYKSITRASQVPKSRYVRAAKSSKSGRLVRKPNGVYHLASRSIRRKYNVGANYLRFVWFVNGTRGITIPPTGRFRSSYHARNKRYTGPYIYPSLVYVVSGKGIVA